MATKPKMVIYYLIPYLCILIIPLFVGFYAYNRTVVLLIEEEQRASQSMLEQIKDTLERRFDDLEQRLFGLVNLLEVGYLAGSRDPLGNRDYYMLAELKSALLRANLGFSYSVYFRGIHMAVTPRGLYQFPADYPRLFHYGEWDYDTWHEELGGLRQKRHFAVGDVWFEGRTERAAMYVLPYFHRNSQTAAVYFVAFIPESELHELFDHLPLGATGWAYIEDAEGNVIVRANHGEQNSPPNRPASDGVPQSGAHAMITSVVTSPIGWKYVAVLPRETVLAKATYIKQITLILFFVAFGMGIVAAFLFAYRHVKPVKDMMDMLAEFVAGEQSVAKNPVQQIKQSVRHVLADNHHMNLAMTKQTLFLRTVFVEKLLRGEFKSKKEIAAMASLVAFSLPEGLFAVIIFRIHGYEDLVTEELIREAHEHKHTVKQMIDHAFAPHSYFHDLEDDAAAVLLVSDKSDAAGLTARADQILKTIMERLYLEHRIGVFFAGGSACGDIADAWRSFQEASRVLDSNYSNGRRHIVWFAAASVDEHHFYYPLDVEERLLHIVKAGEKEAAVQLLQHVYHENFENRKLSSLMYNQLLSEIKGTLLRIVSQTKQDPKTGKEIASRLYKLPQGESWKSYQALVQLFYRLIDTIASNKQHRNRDLVLNITEHVKQHYSDPNLSVTSIATAFQLSDNYISTLFKEHTNNNLSHYIEEIRIGQACKLFDETGYSVQEVAELVGYNSDKSFRRAFKRNKGIQPTAYRTY